MFLAMLLGMVMNVGRHVDGKIRMQNAADSAAYSGGVVLARGMNTLAFTNHLLCDVFAVTAVLARGPRRELGLLRAQILAAWSKVAQVFSSSGFPKFTALGSAIQQKVPLEQQMVDSYSAWAKSVSDQVLPLMEEILSQELIPQYQRAVVVAFPDIAQSAAQRDGRRGTARPTTAAARCSACSGGPTPGRWAAAPNRATRPTSGPCPWSIRNSTRWRTRVSMCKRRSPSGGRCRICTSIEWNAELLSGFDQLAKMSQFAGLWRSFTCGYLEHLLNVEYPQSNLPMVIYENPAQTANPTTTLAEALHLYQRGLLEEAAGVGAGAVQESLGGR